MSKPILAALVASFFAAGCADAPVKANAEQRAEPVYRTGSNIAVKNRDGPADGPVTMSREDVERARETSNPSSFIPKGK